MKIRILDSESGIALLMTLWIGVLLAVVGAGFALSMRTGLASTRNFKEDILAYYHAVGALEDAVKYIAEDEDLTLDFYDTEGRMMVAEDGEPFISLRELEGFGSVEVKLEDESSRIGLNGASRGTLIIILTNSGVDDADAEELADAILDWRDADDQTRENGAEDDEYDSDGYEAKDGPFSTVEELLLVKGVDEDILYGNPDRELTGIFDQVSVCNRAGMNVNTISSATMQALGMDYACIDQVTKLQQAGPIRQIPACASRRGVRLSFSRCFRIEASATPAGTDYVRTVEALISRTPQGGKSEIQVIFWRDDVS